MSKCGIYKNSCQLDEKELDGNMCNEYYTNAAPPDAGAGELGGWPVDEEVLAEDELGGWPVDEEVLAEEGENLTYKCKDKDVPNNWLDDGIKCTIDYNNKCSEPGLVERPLNYMESVLSMYDVDGDGTLDQEEFGQLMGKEWGKTPFNCSDLEDEDECNANFECFYDKCHVDQVGAEDHGFRHFENICNTNGLVEGCKNKDFCRLGEKLYNNRHVEHNLQPDFDIWGVSNHNDRLYQCVKIYLQYCFKQNVMQKIFPFQLIH